MLIVEYLANMISFKISTYFAGSCKTLDSKGFITNQFLNSIGKSATKFLEIHYLNGDRIT